MASSGNDSQPNYNFFKQFIQKNASLNHLLIKCHPNLLDCKKIFSEKYYLRFFEAYCKAFDMINNNPTDPLYQKYNFFRVTKISLLNHQELTGGMNNLISKGVFNFNAIFYKVEFLEKKDSEYGLSYNYFCYLNNRWVCFPKPWRLL